MPLQQRVAFYAFFNALSQTVLKLGSPGVPDIYQGNELWDYSLVDPDNRRPVDYARRQAQLAALRAQLIEGDPARLAADLLAHPQDGGAKLYVTHQLLQARRATPGP